MAAKIEKYLYNNTIYDMIYKIKVTTMAEYIADLDTSQQRKLILAIIRNPQKIADVAAKANMGYSTVHQHLAVLISKGWAKKVKTMSGKTFYETTDAITFEEDVSRPINTIQNPDKTS